MDDQGALFSNIQDIVLMLIVIVALISGVHSMIVLIKLRTQDAGIKTDIKFVLATFNILISLVSMCAVVAILQLNVNLIIKQAGDLLAQLNK